MLFTEHQNEPVDLLFYVDDSLSDVSRKAVEEHVETCENCRKYLEEAQEACRDLDSGETKKDFLAEAGSLKKAKKTMRKKKIWTIVISAAAAAVAIVLIGYGIISKMRNTFLPVTDTDSITVHYDFDGNLLADLEGQAVAHTKMVNLTLKGDSGEKNCLIFGAETTQWDQSPVSRNPMTRENGGYFQLVLANADQGADQIDQVYYLVPEIGKEDDQFGTITYFESIRDLDSVEGLQMVFDKQNMTAKNKSVISKSDLTVDYGTSSLYTKEDMDAAISKIADQFSAMESCEMHTIRYTSDDCNSQENIDRTNKLSGRKGNQFTQCIEFTSDFRFQGNPESPETEYTVYPWWLARTDGEEWKMVSYGY